MILSATNVFHKGIMRSKKTWWYTFIRTARGISETLSFISRIYQFFWQSPWREIIWGQRRNFKQEVCIPREKYFRWIPWARLRISAKFFNQRHFRNKIKTIVEVAAQYPGLSQFKNKSARWCELSNELSPYLYVFDFWAARQLPRARWEFA